MPRELDSCVKQVKARGEVSNPYAVCRASLGTDKEIKARRKKKSKKVQHRGKKFNMRD